MRKLYITEKDVNGFVKSLQDNERSINTVKKYERDLRKLMAFLSERELSKDLLLDFKTQLIKTYATSSANSIIAAVNAFLDYLDVPQYKLKQFKQQRKIFRPKEKEISKAEYIKLINVARKRGLKRIFAIMQTICASGIRVSELQYFTVEALKNGYVKIINKGKERISFLSKDLKKLLKNYCVENKIESGVIFRTRSGKPVNRHNIWADMKKLCKEAEVSEEKVFPHNLRRLFAKIYYDIRKDIVKLANILGHSSTETTRIYLMSSVDEYKRELEHMNLIIPLST